LKQQKVANRKGKKVRRGETEFSLVIRDERSCRGNKKKKLAVEKTGLVGGYNGPRNDKKGDLGKKGREKK